MIILRDIYRAGQPDDLQMLYDLLKERPPEANISHREMPTFEQHRQFVTRQPYAAWYVIEHVETSIEPPYGHGTAASKEERTTVIWAGTIYLTKQREVGIFLRREYQRAGWGREALKILRQQHPGPILANVAPGNVRSHAFFQAAGGRVIQHTYEL